MTSSLSYLAPLSSRSDLALNSGSRSRVQHLLQVKRPCQTRIRPASLQGLVFLPPPMRVCKKGTRASDQDGFVKLSSRVVASDAGRWKMDVYNPATQEQVNLPIQVKIGNGPDKAHQPFWTRAGNFSVFPCHHTHYGPPSGTPPMMHVWIKVGRPGVPVHYRLTRE